MPSKNRRRIFGFAALFSSLLFTLLACEIGLRLFGPKYYEFPNDTTVRFAIDRQRTEWSITGIRVRGSIIEIDVDGNLGIGGRQNSTIKVEILEENALFISSGLHPGMPFQRAS